MRRRSRSLLLALLALAYVLVGALRASDGGFAWLCVLALPIAILVAWDASKPPARGEDWVLPATRTAVRATSFAAAIWVASDQAPPGIAFFEVAAYLAVVTSGVATLVALARIARLGGLLVVSRSATRLHEPMLLALLGLFGLSVMANAHWARAPAQAELVGATLATMSMAAIALVSYRLRRLRRVDLGAFERLTATFTCGSVALLVSLTSTAMGLGAASRILPAAACATALVCTAACIVRDPALVARAQRTTVVVATLALPAGLFCAAIAGRAARDAGTIAFLALSVGVVVGLLAVRLGRPLGPERARWSDGFQAASRASLRADPAVALTAALTALRDALGPSSASPELWCVQPSTVFFVDRAGYGQTLADQSLPRLALELCESEPEQTLRTEVLQTLEVRRADIRPVLHWLHSHDALSLTLLRDEDGPLGALLLPVAGRRDPLTLEEVRELRTLGDRLACLLGATSLIARAQVREMSAHRGADTAEDRALAAEHLLSLVHTRNEAHARRLAQRAAHAAYSPAARLVLDELSRLGALGAPLHLLTPAGIDPIPYAAHAHAHGPRSRGPLVVVDGVIGEDRALGRWQDPTSSPLSLAHGGSLVILNITSLPESTQNMLAESLATRRAPGGAAQPLDIGVIATSTVRGGAAAASELSPALGDRLGGHTVALPTLAARAEDLRALFIDRLARLGMRLCGRPLGLDPHALATLIEHAWPGNELELDDVLTRAVALVEGDVLTLAHLEQVGFVLRAVPARRGPRGPRAGEPRTSQVP